MGREEIGANLQTDGRVEEEIAGRWDTSREAVLRTNLEAAMVKKERKRSRRGTSSRRCAYTHFEWNGSEMTRGRSKKMLYCRASAMGKMGSWGPNNGKAQSMPEQDVRESLVLPS